MQLRSISWTLFIINNNKNLRQLSYTFSELYENIGLTVARMKVREFSLLRKTKNKSKVKMMNLLRGVLKIRERFIKLASTHISSTMTGGSFPRKNHLILSLILRAKGSINIAFI